MTPPFHGEPRAGRAVHRLLPAQAPGAARARPAAAVPRQLRRSRRSREAAPPHARRVHLLPRARRAGLLLARPVRHHRPDRGRQVVAHRRAHLRALRPGPAGRPRVQTADEPRRRAAVGELDFRMGDETYRIARTLKSSGAPQSRLERLSTTGTHPVADRVKDIEEAGRPHPRPRLRRVHAVGRAAAGPVRRVPEGQARGAAQDPGHAAGPRRVRAHARLVNRKASDARRRREFLLQQLAAPDFADASPERPGRARADLLDAEEAAAGREATRKTRSRRACARRSRCEPRGGSCTISTRTRRRKRRSRSRRSPAAEGASPPAAARRAPCGAPVSAEAAPVDPAARSRAGPGRHLGRRAGASRARGRWPVERPRGARGRRRPPAARARRRGRAARRGGAGERGRARREGGRPPSLDQRKRDPRGSRSAQRTSRPARPARSASSRSRRCPGRRKPVGLEQAEAAARAAVRALEERAEAAGERRCWRARRWTGTSAPPRRRVARLEERCERREIVAAPAGRVAGGAGFLPLAIAEPEALVAAHRRRGARRHAGARGTRSARGRAPAVEQDATRLAAEVAAAETQRRQRSRAGPADIERTAGPLASSSSTRCAARWAWRRAARGTGSTDGRDEQYALESAPAAVRARAREARAASSVCGRGGGAGARRRARGRARPRRRQALELDESRWRRPWPSTCGPTSSWPSCRKRRCSVSPQTARVTCVTLSQGRYCLLCDDQEFAVERPLACRPEALASERCPAARPSSPRWPWPWPWPRAWPPSAPRAGRARPWRAFSWTRASVRWTRRPSMLWSRPSRPCRAAAGWSGSSPHISRARPAPSGAGRSGPVPRGSDAHPAVTRGRSRVITSTP